MREIQSRRRWSYVSTKLFARSGMKYFRTRQQCREHWINYLDPKLKKGKWSIEEDVLLFKLVVKIGKRWSKIVKHFDGERN